MNEQKAFVVRTVCIAGVIALIVCKVAFLGYRPDSLTPDVGYDVRVHVDIQPGEEVAPIQMYLPASDDRQHITTSYYRGPLPFSTVEDSRGKRGQWLATPSRDPVRITYRYHARIDNIRFDLSSDLKVPAQNPRLHAVTLQEPRSPRRPLSPLKVETLFQQIPLHSDSLLPMVTAIYEFARHTALDELEGGRPNTFTAHKSPEDAADEVAIRLHVFLAMTEHINLPGRLVGGILFDEHGLVPTYQWAELRINDRWIPFDLQLGHFASLSTGHLKLYEGTSSYIAYPPGRGITHAVEVQREEISEHFIRAAARSVSPSFNPFHLWQSFLDTDMPLVSLKILLLIPVAATVVAFFRNVIGIETYGVFLPALIATSGLHSGILPALTGFLLVTLLVALLNTPLERMGLLYVPKLALMLLAVVGILLGMSFASFQFGMSDFFSLSLLPLIILAISAERLSQHLEEEGLLKAAQVMGMTLIVIVACFLIIDQTIVQWAMLSFPELLIGVGVANLWMGRWIGIRATEYHRFKPLLKRDSTPHPLLHDTSHEATRVPGETPAPLNLLGINHRNGIIIHQSNKKRDMVLANDKHVTKRLMARHDIPIPATLLTFSEIRELNEKWDQVERLDEFVVKPAGGRRGNNILVLKKDRDGWSTPGGRLYDAAMLKNHIANIVFGSHSGGNHDTAIVEYRVHTHPFFTSIYAQGLPDLRVITHHGHIVQAMLRIPTKDSDGKANLHQGALGVGIDLNTGTLRRGYYKDAYTEQHPDSAKLLTGLRLPYWPEIIAISKKTAQLIPLQYLGIDIVIDRHRGPLVLEINARPGLQIQNINEQGLLPILEHYAPTQ